MMAAPDLSIAQRLAIGFGLFFVIVAIFLAATMKWQADSARAEATYAEAIAPLRGQVSALERSVYRVAVALRSVFLNPTENRVDAYHRQADAARSALRDIDRSALETDDQPLLAAIVEELDAYFRAADVLVAGRVAGPVDLDEELQLLNLRDAVLVDVEDLRRRQEERAAEALQDIGTARRQVFAGALVSSALTLLVLLVLAWFTVRSISVPAKRLVQTARALEQGNWQPALAMAGRTTGPYATRDEMQLVANAFGSAAVTLERREQRLRADRQLAAAVASSLNREDICSAALKGVVRHLKAELGIVYWLPRDTEQLLAVASHAVSGELIPLAVGEGVPGLAARDRELVLLNDIPADSGFSVKLGYDHSPVKAVAAVPLLFGETLHGVLLVASLRSFSDDAISFLEAGAERMGTGLQHVDAHERIRILISDLKQRNQEIQAQNEELQAQNEEIQAQSQQLQVQHEEMQAQNEELLNQSEELRNHAAALADADEHKNKFLGMLAHELRNPMAPIANGMYLLKRAAAGSEEALRAQDIIERQTRHLMRLIDDLLDVTRISEGKIYVKRDRVDLAVVVRACIDDFAVSFEQNTIVLDVDLPDAPVEVLGDQTRLCQVLGNLLNNSIKFNNPSGKVRLSLRKDAANGHAVLQVTDSGIGIEASLLPQLFHPFSQGPVELSRTNGGLGLGLALVKALVELHGGTVTAHSEGSGKGAQFVIHLPLAAAA